ncbi:HtaA domain-containing protein [Streptomyces sp. M19]
MKEGFRSYVTGPIAGGSIEVADGAEQAPTTARSPSPTAPAVMTPTPTPCTPPSRAACASPATRARLT